MGAAYALMKQGRVPLVVVLAVLITIVGIKTN